MNAGESAAFIGRSMKLRGELSGAEDLLIEGEFEGQLRLTGGRLTVGPEGRVRAGVSAENILIAGKVEGSIRASGTVHLSSTAVVTGDLFAARLSMEEGAELHGQVDPTRRSEALPPAAAVAAAPMLPLFASEAQEVEESSSASAETDAAADPDLPLAVDQPAEESEGHGEASASAEPVARPLPAALAAAARQFGEATGTILFTEGSSASSESAPTDLPELAETKA